MISPVDSTAKQRRTRLGQAPGRVVWVGLLAASCLSFGVIAGALTPANAAPKAASKAAGKGKVTFGVEPATAHKVATLPDLDFGATAGGTLTSHVAVLNFSAKPLSLQLYATDAINTSNGGFGLLPANAKPVDAGAWVILPKSSATVRVPAQTAKAPGMLIVPFTLRVPTNATPGDHVGAIVASLQTVGHNSSGQTVILDQRVGTRLFIRVAGTLAPKLTLTDLRATYHGTTNPVGRGSVTVSYRITNAGNVDLAVNQGVAVTGLFGSKRQVSLAGLPLLLPGDSLQETAHLSGVWPEFIVRAKVTAQPLPTAGDTDPRLLTVTASTRLWAIPWTLLAIVVLALVALRFVFVLRKRRSGPADPQPAVREQVKA
jgi:hypothetical protein